MQFIMPFTVILVLREVKGSELNYIPLAPDNVALDLQKMAATRTPGG